MSLRWSLLLVPIGLLGVAWLAHPTHGFVVALRPGLEAADEDQDGRMSSTELARSSPTLVSFHKIDLDQDGAISEPELLVHLLAEDPATFDGGHKQLDPTLDEALSHASGTKSTRVLHYLFEFMLVEVITVDRRVPLPSDEQLQAAADTGSLDSPESQRVAANLVAAYQACGLEVPSFLAEVEPLLAEPGLRQPIHPREGSKNPRRPPRAQGPGGGPPEPGQHPVPGRKPPGPPKGGRP